MAIKQPKNVTITQGSTSMKLIWGKSFARNRTESFSDVQKFVDSECIRLMVPYTPMRNGMLQKGAVLGTKIGSGEIHYTVPYARYQYYGKLMVSSVTGSAFAKMGESKVLTEKDLVYNKARHPLAQRLWFETMKHNHKEQILRGAAAIARRK
jgi:hypothetical protein